MDWGILLFFVAGAFIGSVINAVVFRTAAKKSVVKGRSKCQKCDEAVSPLDLIPILSYIRLRGRCRKCHAKFSIQYPLIELNLALVCTFLYLRYMTGYSLPPFYEPLLVNWFIVRDIVFVSMLYIVLIYDARYLLIPDVFSVPAIIVALLFNFALGLSPASIGLGIVAALAVFGSQYIISKGKWIGGGDVRLAVLMGCMLGLYGSLLAILLCYVIGASVAIILLIRGKVKIKTSKLPLGSFIAAAIGMLMVFENVLVDWYTNLMGLGF